MKYQQIKIIILSIVMIASAQNDKLCKNAEASFKLRDQMHIWLQSAHPNSALKRGNVLWPLCEDTLNILREVNKDLLRKNAYWLQRYNLPKLYNLDSAVVIKNMTHGDEWIVNRYVSDNEYYQYIDGRTLTILVKMKLEMHDTVVVREQFTQRLKKYILIDLASAAIMNYDGVQIDMVLQTGVKSFGYPTDIKVWSNGEYVIIDIPKIGTPYVDKFGLSVYRTINGIAPDDTRPYIRFSEGTIDMEKEVYKYVPDVNEVLNKRKKDFIGGGEPVRGYFDGF